MPKAASKVEVKDSINGGGNFLPSAGVTDRVIPKGNSDVAPKPIGAVNSGTKLSFPGPNFNAQNTPLRSERKG